MKRIRALHLVSIGLAFLIAVSGGRSVHAESAHQPSTVVELYTSQGCSSCPPADKLLGELVKDENVLGLSFGVTYWDYIGWKDIFGSRDYDTRQAEYRTRFNSRYVYTPQMVVGGTDHIVGSDRSGVTSLIEKHADHAKSLPLAWSFNGDQLNINLPVGSGNATLWLVDLDREKDVDIRRGENTGKIITYHNIVRNIRAIGKWNGEAKTIELDLADMRAEGRDGCALLVQQDGYGPILAALEVML